MVKGYMQHPGIIGYARRTDLADLEDEAQPGGSHIRIGLDHRGCWAEEPPYDHLVAVYLDLPGELDKALKRARRAEMDSHRILKTYKGLERVAKVVSDHADTVCGENNLLRQEVAALKLQLEAMAARLPPTEESTDAQQ